MVNDLGECAQFCESIRFDFRELWMGFLQCAKDFHPFDRVNPKIGFHIHVEFQHFRRVASLFTDNSQKSIFQCFGADYLCGCGGFCWLRSRCCGLGRGWSNCCLFN